MPIYQKKNISASIKIGIWKITEMENELFNLMLNLGFDKAAISKTNNKQHLKQWMATRLILATFFDDAKIIYDDLGKPSLTNGWNISISHSNEFVAIILNKNEHCGIDIEKISEKPARIKHKFLNPEDLKNITSNEHLTLYWGAKEALYKYYGKKEVLFIEHLFIENFSTNKDNFQGKIVMSNFKKTVDMTYKIIDNYILVYTL